jgi:hypothetical protein
VTLQSATGKVYIGAANAKFVFKAKARIKKTDLGHFMKLLSVVNL